MNKNLKLVLLTFVLCILVVGGIVIIRNRAKDTDKLAETTNVTVTDQTTPTSQLSESTLTSEPDQSKEPIPLVQKQEEKYIEDIFKSYESSGYATQNLLLSSEADCEYPLDSKEKGGMIDEETDRLPHNYPWH